MVRKKIAILLILVLLLSGCSSEQARQQITWLDVFDTVTTLQSFDNPESFSQNAQKLHDTLLQYHKLLDIYQDYPGLNNLKTVNDRAGIAPVEMDGEVLEFLQQCRDYYDLTGGKVNIAFGSVLSLWHDSREAALSDPEHAALPQHAALKAAAAHTDIENLVLDFENSTVYLADPEMRLDVGAVAKGWAAKKAAELLPEGYLLNLGGNLVATGSKPDGGAWSIGIQSPFDTGSYLRTVSLSSGAAVTSGDYQRYFEVQGVRYNHIIDPETLDSARLWKSVTVLCDDSALADCLSTALFLLDYETGSALAISCGAEALWVAADGSTRQTDSFPE